MVLVLHGEAGGWDELLIALVAFAVLWIAVKLAGRKSAGEDDETEASAASASDGEATKEIKDPAHPSRTKSSSP
jgi:hypothetical protein